jgi:hypothetical protein
VAQTGGYDRAYEVCAVLLVVAAVVAATVLRRPVRESAPIGATVARAADEVGDVVHEPAR